MDFRVQRFNKKFYISKNYPEKKFLLKNFSSPLSPGQKKFVVSSPFWNPGYGSDQKSIFFSHQGKMVILEIFWRVGGLPATEKFKEGKVSSWFIGPNSYNSQTWSSPTVLNKSV